jgi:hypothetical protein
MLMLRARRCLLLVALLAATALQAQTTFRIDEAGVKLRLHPKPVLALPILNTSGKALHGEFKLELLNTDDKVAATLTGTFDEKLGTTLEKVPWDVNQVDPSPSALGWLRLHYVFSPQAGSGVSAAEGVLQLSRVIVGSFEVRMTAASTSRPGAKFPVRVRVDDPTSGKPLHGVHVKVSLDISDDSTDNDRTLNHDVVTDLSGYALYTFDLPKDIKTDEADLKAVATRGVFEDEADLTVRLLWHSKLTLSTDKPLYQPGQTAHVRLLVLDSDKQAMSGKNLILTIEDQEGDEKLHQNLKTSPFGVTTADWEIPEKLRLGDYKITVALADKDQDIDYDTPKNIASIRVSRYELPNFTVKADSGKKYYLPGEDAEVTISADYLFGKPVQTGKVRLVQEQNRHWDFSSQQWTSDESNAIEGSLDRGGKFKTKVDLSGYFKDFARADYARFEDVSFAAYVTDPSTSHTEQRRFHLRLSERPIQLYVVGSTTTFGSEPETFYVTSSYADGMPASVRGTLYVAEPNNSGEFEEYPWEASREKIASFHTNKFGVGKVTIRRIPDRFLITPKWWNRGYRQAKEDEPPKSARLLLEASDAQARSGRSSGDWTVFAQQYTYMRVKTQQLLYHPGDALRVSVETNSPVRDAIVAVSTQSGVIESKVIAISRGQTQVDFDFDPRMRGAVEVTAFALTSAEDENYALSGSVHVIFPALMDLSVALRMPQTTYKPGENASAAVRVRTPLGQPVESELGVLVFDRAVAERVRTDEAFGRSYGFQIDDYLDPSPMGKIAGIGYRDLLNLDNRSPFSSDLQLLAEALMAAAPEYWWDGRVDLAGGEEYAREASSKFAGLTSISITPVRNAFDKTFQSTGRYPKNDAQVAELLGSAGTNWKSIRDPWGMPYRTKFSVAGADDVLEIISNGIDKSPNTSDDIVAGKFSWPYYRSVGEKIETATRAYAQRTRKYIRDYQTLRDELKQDNIDLDSLRDPWGREYRYEFSIEGPYYQIQITSAGPDGIFDSKTSPSLDDITEWHSSIHYFLSETDDLGRALAEHFQATKQFPQNEKELEPVLHSAKLENESLLDPWEHPYHFTFSKRSRYGDSVHVQTYQEYQNQKARRVTEVTPVTQELAYIDVMSYGPKNNPNTAFQVAEFSRVLAEQNSKDLQNKSTGTIEGPLPSGSGAIRGVITDPSGAVIPNAEVTAISSSGRSFTAQTDSAGLYVLTSLPAGIYEITFSATGFTKAVISRVPVQMGATTALDAQLQVGAAMETVMVEAAATQLSTSESAEVATIKKQLGTAAPEKPLFTPRLRKYFPETLVWKPEIMTDKHGGAHIDFSMADNITAWSMSVIASTESGQVGVAQKELRTFQPFFVEHDPPKVLTQGDQISLPVVLRNYSDKPQTLLTELEPEPWFSMLSPGQQHVTVAPSADANAVFTFRADANVSSGKQRVTAHNSETGDAVEREVRVYPDGQEVSFTTGRVLGGAEANLSIAIPASAIAGSSDAELRIYPNLIAHVLDAMTGISKQPAGCAEQITSIAYVSLQALQLLKQAGIKENDTSDPRAVLMAGVHKAVEIGYQQLIALQQLDGSFPYWSGKPGDPALTAYVLRFLSGAKEFVEVNPSIIAKAQVYVISKQDASGAWLSYSWDAKKDQPNPMLTAYILRSFATSTPPEDAKQRSAFDNSTTKALSYLEDRIDEWKTAYLVGNYAVAAAALKHPQHMANALDLLRSLAHDEGSATYWNLETNTTPFYGWGFAGRLETTALAVEALAQMKASTPNADVDEQLNRGLQYLLTHKDRYCAWYSTQATQNVIETLIAAMPFGAETGANTQATVLVNGKKLGSIDLPRATEVTGPKVVELGSALSNGDNRLTIQRTGSAGAMHASLVTSYFLPWAQSQATHDENFKPGDRRALHLKVNYDQTELKLEEEVHCKVEVERVGFQGYGMMIAEIGLPPGAEVSRESLEEAKNAVDGYEIQPDRVVFYVWPSAGGTTFNFSFRPRYRIDALSAPSLLYDYYNPESNAVVTPVRFTVR